MIHAPKATAQPLLPGPMVEHEHEEEEGEEDRGWVVLSEGGEARGSSMPGAGGKGALER